MDGSPWDFENSVFEINGSGDQLDQPNVMISYDVGIDKIKWMDDGSDRAVVCAAPQLSDIKGAIPKILQLGRTENAALMNSLPISNVCSKR